MATSDKLEGSLGSGISGIKSHMKFMQQKIKDINAKAEANEKLNDSARQAYIKSHGRQQALKDRVMMIDEKLEKIAEKMKDVTKRALEKEKFMEESAKFNRSLKVTAPDEGEVAEMEEKLKIHKDIYSKNYEKYQVARNRKIEMEQELEHSELKSHELMRRVQALKTELEYNQLEEARREEACKVAIDAAFKAEKGCMDLQHGLDIIMKRKEVAVKSINKLEKDTTKAENAKDTLSFERRRMEATIKECLLSIKSQQGK